MRFLFTCSLFCFITFVMLSCDSNNEKTYYANNEKNRAVKEKGDEFSEAEEQYKKKTVPLSKSQKDALIQEYIDVLSPAGDDVQWLEDIKNTDIQINETFLQKKGKSNDK